MNEIKLLQQYSKSLQLQNQAKDKQRIILYQKIDNLSVQNKHLYAQIQHIKTISQTSYLSTLLRQKQQDIQNLNQNILYLQQQLNNSIIYHQQKDINLQNSIHEKQQNQQKMQILQKNIQQYKFNQNKFQKQINTIIQQNNILKHHCNLITKQLQQQQKLSNQQTLINQIKQNYQRVIKKLTKQHQMEKQYLHKKNSSLLQEIQQLKKIIQTKQTQLKLLRNKKTTQNHQNPTRNGSKFSVSRSGSSGSQDPKSQRQDITMNIDLIKQNNKLIQRIAQLQKQKNLSHLDNLDKNLKFNHKKYLLDTPSISPLRNINSNSNILYQNNSASKLRMRIQSLKQENQQLLERLRV